PRGLGFWAQRRSRMVDDQRAAFRADIAQPAPVVPAQGLDAEVDAMMAAGLLDTVRTLARELYGENQAYPCDDVKRMAQDAARRSTPPVGPEQVLASDILAELTRARAKFPGKNVTFAALVEEVGELATAIFEES